MRRIFRILWALPVGILLAGACSEQGPEVPQESAAFFYAGTEETEVTKVYADGTRLLWNADDEISIFNRETYNRQYRFGGSEGDATGVFNLVSGEASQGAALAAAYAVYPYSSANSIGSDGTVGLKIPFQQSYSPGGLDHDSIIMVAATTDNYLSLRNVCGFLSVRFTGNGRTVKTLSLSGNRNEPLAGTAHISIEPGGEPSTVLYGSPARAIVLDCGDGVLLEKGAVTEFRFALLPTTFSKGLTLTVETDGGKVILKREEAITVARSRISRMETAVVNPYPVLGTGLRSVFVTTPDGQDIDSKEYWKENCTVVITDDEGKVYYNNSEVSVKGRGNTTWYQPKKPYTLKLPSKDDLIGVGAKGKRWVLIANWMDRTLLRHDVSYEIARRTSLEWTPSGEFVELFLNGKHLGNYWLGEQIKVGKGRLEADYLIEMDTYFDETWRFYSDLGFRVNQNAWGLPINVKEPDEDEMNEAKLSELKGLVANVENAIYGGGDYASLINVQTFIDWYLVHELAGNDEPNHPKSSYFYFRDGIMYAGPVWDFDWMTYMLGRSGLIVGDSIYYGELLYDPSFAAALKARWQELKPIWADIPDYIDARAALLKTSEAINHSMWPSDWDNTNGDFRLSYPQAVARMKKAFTDRLVTLEEAINAL